MRHVVVAAVVAAAAAVAVHAEAVSSGHVEVQDSPKVPPLRPPSGRGKRSVIA